MPKEGEPPAPTSPGAASSPRPGTPAITRLAVVMVRILLFAAPCHR